MAATEFHASDKALGPFSRFVIFFAAHWSIGKDLFLRGLSATLAILICLLVAIGEILASNNRAFLETIL